MAFFFIKFTQTVKRRYSVYGTVIIIYYGIPSLKKCKCVPHCIPLFTDTQNRHKILIMLLLKYFLLGTDLTHSTIYMVTLKQSCQICGAVKKINFSFTLEF